jgi:hypothetical protein
MIVRLEFTKNTPGSFVDTFLKKPRGTCLDSSSAHNITPTSIKQRGLHISFWFIDDNALKHFYGGKVCIRSLLTLPGIIGVNEILHDEKITLKKLHLDISELELVKMLEPFL